MTRSQWDWLILNCINQQWSSIPSPFSIVCSTIHLFCHDPLVRTSPRFHNNSGVSVTIQPPSSVNSHIVGVFLTLDTQEQRLLKCWLDVPTATYTLCRNPSLLYCIIASCGRWHCAIGAWSCEIPSHQQRYTDDDTHMHAYVHTFVLHTCFGSFHLLRPLSIQVCLSVWSEGVLLHTGECVLHDTVCSDRWAQIKGPTPPGVLI